MSIKCSMFGDKHSIEASTYDWHGESCAALLTTSLKETTGVFENRLSVSTLTNHYAAGSITAL